MLGWFFERLQTHADGKALVYPDRSGQECCVTYRQLLARIDEWRSELPQHGVGSGTVVAVEGSFTLAATTCVLALMDAGAIVAPLVEEMRPHREAFLSIAQASLLVECDARGGVRFEKVPVSSPANPLLGKLRSLGHPGLIIFSSGSSGSPKAILHDFTKVLGKFEKQRQRKTTLCFLLFDHIGGVDTLLGTLSCGGTLVSVARREPVMVARAIEAHSVHTLPTSPTFLNLLLMAGIVQDYDLSSLKVIAYGTEPMPADTLRRLRETFPHVGLVQTYGMSELGVLRSRSKGSDSPWVEFTQEGFQTKVVDGLLWVKADTAMLGYLNAPDLFDEDGWLNTQDAVEVDGKFMRILGRQTDLINVGGQKVYPNEVESHLLQVPNVRDAAVFGKPHPMTGQIVAARINLKEPEPASDFKVRMHKFLRERLAPFQIPRLIEFTDEDQFGTRFKKLRR